MTEPTGQQRCPDCGLELPTSGNQGCTGCLLRLGIQSDAAPVPETSPLPAGLQSRFFGDYEILEEIARGGMGVVYKARQLTLNRLVALKMIQTGPLLSAEARLRFGVEIEAVAHLDHPNIVPLYESSEHQGIQFFTMRFMEGGSLSDYLKTPRSPREVIPLLVRICRAVHYAHQRGILHRDIKPSNILLDQHGEPHVADFGLAKSLEPDSGFTFTSSILGSPNYMAPEQATGQIRQLSTAADIYGLGALLYHLLTGRPPFQAGTPLETLRQVTDADPIPPRRLQPGVDLDLETICLKCLRKEPLRRYGTAEDLAEDLERWLDGRPIRARPLGPLGTVWRWSRRHPAIAILGLALLLALAGIVVGTSIAGVRIAAAERRAADHLRESILGQLRALRLTSAMGQRAEGLALIREAGALGGSDEYRQRLRDELLSVLVRTGMPFVAAPGAAPAADPVLTVFDRGFRRMATVRNATNIVLQSLIDGSRLMDLVSPGQAIERLDSFSPDGRFLAAWHADGLRLWDLQTGQPCATHVESSAIISFARHRSAVLVQSVLNEATLVELPSGQTLARIQPARNRPGGRPEGWHSFALSPDGSTLAAASGRSRIVELLSMTNGQSLILLTNAAPAVALAWNLAGETLAVATTDGRIVTWDPGEDRTVLSAIVGPVPATSVAFDHSGTMVAVPSGDRQIHFLDAASLDPVFSLQADSHTLTFSDQGGRVGPVFRGREFGWLEVTRPREYNEFRVGDESFVVRTGSFSDDGRILAVGNNTNVVLCDPTSGAILLRLPSWRLSATALDPLEDAILAAGTPGMIRMAFHHRAGPRIGLGRPRTIHQGRGWRAFTFSPDGRWFAAANIRSNAAFVFDRTLTNRLSTVGPHKSVEAIAISPDGHWLATGSYHDRSVRVWDVQREALSATLPVGPQPRAAFSPDGRWMISYGDTVDLWRLGDWDEAVPLPFPAQQPVLGAAAFASDSSLLAVVADLFSIQLFDLGSIRPVGVLRPPIGQRLLSLAFSPDRARLVATTDSGKVLVWNLAEIQRSAARFNLGWRASTAGDSAPQAGGRNAKP